MGAVPQQSLVGQQAGTKAIAFSPTGCSVGVSAAGAALGVQGSQSSSVEPPYLLSAFMLKHLEMYFTTKYDPSYGWSKEDRLELHSILSAVDPKSALGSTERYRNARKYYRDVCRVRREQRSVASSTAAATEGLADVTVQKVGYKSDFSEGGVTSDAPCASRSTVPVSVSVPTTSVPQCQSSVQPVGSNFSESSTGYVSGSDFVLKALELQTGILRMRRACSARLD